jgi:SprT-like protein
MNIKHYELIEIAKNFLSENYNLELEIPVSFNTRLKRVFGRLIIKKSRGVSTPVEIQMSVDFMSSHPKQHIIDVFKHELVHYALCKKGLPFFDGHPTFESELKKLNINSTQTYHYLGEMHKYTCKNCGKNIERKRKLVKTAYCICSDGPNLEYKGVINKQYEGQPGEMVSFSAYTGQGVPIKRRNNDGHS